MDQLFGRLMHCLVAFPAKRNQISLDVVTKCATPSQVVNIEILEAATYLTAPVVTHQDFFTQPRIRDGRYSNSRPLSQDGVAHLAFSAGSDGPHVAAERPMDAEHSGALYGILRFQGGARQKIGANHFQRISSRFVAAEHQRGDFKRALDHGQLALVQLEIDDLPGFRFLARSGTDPLPV